jgi:hypothetical protein
MKAGLLAALAFAPLVAPPAVTAQVRLSERATVSQTVDGTVITLDYARPRVRGRSPIFGRRVHWGEVWTPGANMATTLEVSRDVTIDGHAVPRGRYSLWLVVDESERWTLLLDTTWSRFHTARPPEDGGLVRFPVRAASGPVTEVLTFSFPDVTDTGAVLQFQWDDRVIRIPITVAPTLTRSPADVEFNQR